MSDNQATAAYAQKQDHSDPHGEVVEVVTKLEIYAAKKVIVYFFILLAMVSVDFFRFGFSKGTSDNATGACTRNDFET